MPEATGSTPSEGTGTVNEPASRERILAAAGALFAERGFDATPTSRIAEHADVPKGLIHYYFRRKQDLLVALVDRLPDERVGADVAVAGDLRGSLRRLVHLLDDRFESSVLLSHLLWREADTHAAVRDALQARFEFVVERFREVIETALAGGSGRAETHTAALLLARAVHHRHSVSRHAPEQAAGDDKLFDEIDFVASALEGRAG